ncbi:MAG: efflux RND transporter periplasmic adaptor subunit [Thermodesulfobacteriota bacterium]
MNPNRSERKFHAKLILVTALVTLIISFGAAYLFGYMGPRQAPPPAEGPDTLVEGSLLGTNDEVRIYTCSMHPQIRQPEPGDCPICGMDLIPLETDAGGDEGPRTMRMSESARALAEIQTVLVHREFPEARVALVGKLDYDETREKSLTARFPARIEELFVNFTGIQVKQGEHLAKVYSPELLSAQRELLAAHRSNPDSFMARAAREKLLLWDLLPDQIDAIIESDQARDHFVLKAPMGGVVVGKNVKEGDYLKTGEPLFRIVDLSRLWLYLDAYESDLIWLRYGQDVAFTVEAFPGETFHGLIAFIEPEVDPKTRTVSVRVNVDNTDTRLKPGMFVRGTVEVRMAEGGKVYAPEFAGKWVSPMHPEIVKDQPGQCDVCGMDLVPAEELGYVENTDESAPLIIPASSVLRTGRRAVVYVEQPEAERPTYEGREIVLGPRAGDAFLVTAGLDAGERIVTNGAFKIDSALQIQAKASMMNPKGGGPMPGHDHGGDSGGSAEGDHSQHRETAGLDIPPDLASKLIEPYLRVQSALAADDLAGAKAGAKEMMDITGHSGPLPDLLHDLLAADTLDAFRKPRFETLSNAMIAAAKAEPSAFGGELLIMHCPMVYGDQGADWLQRSEPLQNPYFGAMMLRCGEVKETIRENGNGAHDH